MKTYYVDGGAKIEPPDYKFHDAYFTVIDDEGEEVHVDLYVGDIYSGLAEFKAIQWVVDNVVERPIRITSDCQTAIAWARHGGKTKLHTVERLDLTNITLEYEHNNLADQYNATYISPKQSKSEYYQRWVNSPKSHKKPRMDRKRKANLELKLF